MGMWYFRYSRRTPCQYPCTLNGVLTDICVIHRTPHYITTEYTLYSLASFTDRELSSARRIRSSYLHSNHHWSLRIILLKPSIWFFLGWELLSGWGSLCRRGQHSQAVEILAYEDHPSTESTDICMHVVSAMKYSGLSMPMGIVRDYYCHCYCYFHLASPVYTQ